MNISIHSLNRALPQDITLCNGKEIHSGIYKKPTNDEVTLTFQGIEQDGVGHKEFHGGSQRALHLYPYEHYTYFNKKAGKEIPVPTFGENLSILGYTEEVARVGDQLTIGTAIIEVSQPTERCQNIGLSIGVPQMLKWIMEEKKTGFYCRVIREGVFSVVSEVTLLERGPENATISHINKIFYDHIGDTQQVNDILNLTKLSSHWKERMQELHQRSLNTQ